MYKHKHKENKSIDFLIFTPMQVWIETFKFMKETNSRQDQYESRAII